MYHAPVSPDADQLREEPSEEGVDSLAFDAASDRLREAHLHNRQVETRALFAPYFGVTDALAAIVTAWSMFGFVRIELLVAWVCLVLAANWLSFRRSMAAAARGHSRTARVVATGAAIVEAV